LLFLKFKFWILMSELPVANLFTISWVHGAGAHALKYICINFGNLNLQRELDIYISLAELPKSDYLLLKPYSDFLSLWAQKHMLYEDICLKYRPKTKKWTKRICCSAAVRHVYVSYVIPPIVLGVFLHIFLYPYTGCGLMWIQVEVAIPNSCTAQLRLFAS
jgi:hypothetical protein